MGMNIWLMKGYMDTIPRDIDLTARSMVPLRLANLQSALITALRPILCTAILSFIGTYGEFLLARTFLLTTSEKQTVMVGLQIFTAGQYTKTGVSCRWRIDWPLLPIMVIYLVLQDQIVGGV